MNPWVSPVLGITVLKKVVGTTGLVCSCVCKKMFQSMIRSLFQEKEKNRLDSSYGDRKNGDRLKCSKWSSCFSFSYRHPSRNLA